MLAAAAMYRCNENVHDMEKVENNTETNRKLFQIILAMAADKYSSDNSWFIDNGQKHAQRITHCIDDDGVKGFTAYRVSRVKVFFHYPNSRPVNSGRELG